MVEEYKQAFDPTGSVKQKYEHDGFAKIEKFITEESCKKLAQLVWGEFNNKQTFYDKQCRWSDSFNEIPFQLHMHKELAKPIGQILNLELAPTYTYGRIYRPRQILKRHTDRPACEISATLTLDLDGSSDWPIWFSPCPQHIDVPVHLGVGDVALYKGHDVLHWRDPFEGTWHIQTFFHYVDINGKWNDHAGDKYGERYSVRWGDK
jgi:hypothetical protein